MHRNLEKKRAYERTYKALHRIELNQAARARRMRLGPQMRKREQELRRTNWASRLLIAVRCRAKRKGLVFALEAKDLEYTLLCPMCAGTIQFDNTRACTTSPSIDQIIPGKGYTAQNSWIVCNGCNQKKGAATPHMMRLVLQEIAKRGLE